MTYRHSNNPLSPDNHWWHRFKLSSQKFAILLTISAFTTGFVYVALTNSSSAHGFAIEKLERQLTDLRGSNEKLQVQAAELRSLASADLAGRTLGLAPTSSFEVIPASGGAVASLP